MSANESYVTEAYGDFVLFGGVAIEHACKAKLARINSVFLAPDRGFESAVALERGHQDIGRLSAEVKTIGGKEAIRRLCILEPSLKHHIDPATDVLAHRNGEAHLAAGDRGRATRLFVIFVRAVEALLEVTSEEFWGPHTAVVKSALDEHSADVDRLVAERMAGARIRFDETIGGLEDLHKEAVLSISHSRRDAEVDHDEFWPWECPVCASPAVVHGYTEDTDYEVDGDGTSAYPIFTFFAQSLSCVVCGLELDSSEQLALVGIEDSWQNDELDPDDWAESRFGNDLEDHWM